MLSVLIFPKLTTDPKSGGFWKLYLLSFLIFTLCYSSFPVFLYSNKEILIAFLRNGCTDEAGLVVINYLKPYINIIFGIVIFNIAAGASMIALVVAAIYTMSEDYNGILSFLKFVKPYKLIEGIPQTQSAYESRSKMNASIF